MTVRPALTFADPEGPALILDAPGAQAFAVDRETRTIRGLLVPYGRPAFSRGDMYQFAQGTITWTDPSRVKLWVMHDPTRAVGFASELDDRKDGLYGAFKVARGAAGDEALTMAEDKVWDGFSIGLGLGGQFQAKDGVQHSVAVPLLETSLTPAPSFDDARVHSVAASAVGNLTGRNTMKCDKCGKVHPDGVTTCGQEFDQTADQGQAPAAGGLQFDALADAVAKGMAQGLEALRNPQGTPGGPEVVSPGNGQTFHVAEAPPYRFDGVPGDHGFLEDIKSAHFSQDTEAKARLDKFLGEAFAVTTGNTAALNPTQNRPELYVPQLSYSTPLWDLVSKGSIDSKTAFTVPKFTSASGLVGDHTEGVEPTPGTFVAGSQTVTPTALSGKIEVNREVWDQGGSPQADGIIWAEMQNAWAEAREAKIAAALQAVATAELNLGSAVDSALSAALTNYFAGLQFVRGGNRFTAFAADDSLFLPLVAAKDGSNRPLFPVLAPTNAQGETAGAFDSVMIGAQRVRAAWALANLGAASRSFNFVPSSVWAWASAPQRFEFQYQVKSIDLAIWGYMGTAVLRESDVKPIDYDVADA